MPVIVCQHPLVRHKVGLMRRQGMSTAAFRDLVQELGRLLTYEATADLPLTTAVEAGWAGPVGVERLDGPKLTLVPILRAGLGLLDGVLSIVPSAKVSVIGLARDHATLRPVLYVDRFVGRLEERTAIVLDPMLATAGSMIATVDLLKQRGCRDIRAIVLVAAPEGQRALDAAHPDVRCWTAALDERLDEHGYILPGLGDAGDRIFGTKEG